MVKCTLPLSWVWNWGRMKSWGPKGNLSLVKKVSADMVRTAGGRLVDEVT